MKHENSITPSHHHKQNNSPYTSIHDLNLDELNGNEMTEGNINKKRLNLRKRLNKNYKNQCYEKINHSTKSSSSSPLNRCNHSNHTTNCDEKIVFTENKIYIGLNTNNLMATSTSTAPSNHNRKKMRDKTEKPLFNGSGLVADSTIVPQSTESQVNIQSFNNNDGNINEDNVCMKDLKYCDKYHKKLQFVVTQPTDEFDINGNPIIMTTSTSTNNNVNHTHRASSNSSSSHDLDEIVFEKVKYDKNKKYLHDSPSTSSNLSKNSLNLDSLLMMNQQSQSCTRAASQYDNLSWDNIDNSINYYGHSADDYDEDGDMHINQMNYDKLYDQKMASSINYYNPWGSCEDISGCTDEFQYRPSYWDLIKRSTANTLRLNYEGSCDIWDNLQNKNYEIDADSRAGNNTASNSGCWSSSRRTSISTVETWVEDEIFDNSFNEELERRCASFKLKNVEN